MVKGLIYFTLMQSPHQFSLRSPARTWNNAHASATSDYRVATYCPSIAAYVMRQTRRGDHLSYFHTFKDLSRRSLVPPLTHPHDGSNPPCTPSLALTASWLRRRAKLNTESSQHCTYDLRTQSLLPLVPTEEPLTKLYGGLPSLFNIVFKNEQCAERI